MAKKCVGRSLAVPGQVRLGKHLPLFRWGTGCVVHDMVKNTVLLAFELVPEAHRQRFRNLKFLKTSNQICVEMPERRKFFWTVGAGLAKPTA